LRESLVFLDVPAMQQLEAYIGGAGSLLDASRTLIALRPLCPARGLSYSRISILLRHFSTAGFTLYSFTVRESDFMASNMQEKLEKVVSSGTGTKGKNLPGQKQPKCVTGPAKSGATCSKKNKKEIVTSVGS